MALIRVLLIGLIVYLIARSFVRFGHDKTSEKRPDVKKEDGKGKKVSKEIGEYIDYEELDK
jgi:hypothetical protein